MKRFSLLLLSILTLLLIFVLTTGPALAEPTETKSLATLCSLDDAQDYWEANNTVHGRNEHYTEIVEINTPSYIGFNDIWSNWNINLDTMKGVTWGTFDLSVPELNGGWEGHWQGEMTIAWPLVIRPNGHPVWLTVSRANGHGYGDLQGQQIHTEAYTAVNVYDSLDDIPDDVPCVSGKTIEGKYFVIQAEETGFITGRARN